MDKEYTFKEYADSQSVFERYSAYQQRYARNIRESDKVLLSIVAELTGGGEKPCRLLDVGCSTGNLLRHIRARFPRFSLMGGDLMQAVVEQCRADESLKSMQFEVLDILNLPTSLACDIVTVNAVTYLFETEDFERAMKSLCGVLKPGGCIAGFELFHDFRQDLTIVEKSRSHPEGLRLHFRPLSEVKRVFTEAGFEGAVFKPFEIPIDLARKTDISDTDDGWEDLNSYTVTRADGKRLLFRGCLSQPWCHYFARKRQ